MLSAIHVSNIYVNMARVAFKWRVKFAEMTSALVIYIILKVLAMRVEATVRNDDDSGDVRRYRHLPSNPIHMRASNYVAAAAKIQ